MWGQWTCSPRLNREVGVGADPSSAACLCLFVCFGRELKGNIFRHTSQSTVSSIFSSFSQKCSKPNTAGASNTARWTESKLVLKQQLRSVPFALSGCCSMSQPLCCSCMALVPIRDVWIWSLYGEYWGGGWVSMIRWDVLSLGAQQGWWFLAVAQS